MFVLSSAGLRLLSVLLPPFLYEVVGQLIFKASFISLGLAGQGFMSVLIPQSVGQGRARSPLGGQNSSRYLDVLLKSSQLLIFRTLFVGFKP